MAFFPRLSSVVQTGRKNDSLAQTWSVVLLLFLAAVNTVSGHLVRAVCDVVNTCAKGHEPRLRARWNNSEQQKKVSKYTFGASVFIFTHTIVVNELKVSTYQK